MIRPDASTYGVVPIEFLREVERVIGEHRSVLSLVLTRIGERANDGGSLNDDELWEVHATLDMSMKVLWQECDQWYRERRDAVAILELGGESNGT